MSLDNEQTEEHILTPLKRVNWKLARIPLDERSEAVCTEAVRAYYYNIEHVPPSAMIRTVLLAAAESIGRSGIDVQLLPDDSEWDEQLWIAMVAGFYRNWPAHNISLVRADLEALFPRVPPAMHEAVFGSFPREIHHNYVSYDSDWGSNDESSEDQSTATDVDEGVPFVRDASETRWVAIDTTEPAFCSICLVSDQESFVALRCLHTFHEPCLWRWARKERTCPVCRTEINEST